MMDSWTRFRILCALLPEPQYPYRISRDIAAATNGEVVLEAGNLHRHLQQLMAGGLVAEAPTPSDVPDRRRRYFAITPAGKTALGEETERMQQAVRMARAALASGSRR